MNTDPYLRCDDLDDLADFIAARCDPPEVRFYAVPHVWDVPRGFVSTHTRARTLCAPLSPANRKHVRQSLLPGVVGIDPGFLAIVAPDLFLQIGTKVATAVYTAPYSAVPGAGKAMRRDLHAMDVI